MGTRAEIIRAQQEGAEAARRGDPATACPYGRDSILRTMWIQGYAAARREAGQTAAE
ncbi:Rmf/CrpP fold protein [Streptomyces goshikiensis]|uniref:Rmf/CrpP fold protein n=1 Tax=Streptomyces TaxID=1883 RepID=UPI0018FEFF53|nr:Rmf/CrpP fold protein [Streptomyces sp. CB02120-2]